MANVLDFTLERYEARITVKQSLVHSTEAEHIWLIGAIRSGKTAAAMVEAFLNSWDYAGNRGLITRWDYSVLEKTTMTTFFEWVPKNSEVVAKWQDVKHRLELVNGSEILFQEGKEWQKFMGLELGFYVIDQAEEFPSPAAMEALDGRLNKPNVDRRFGIIILNPVSKHHWAYEYWERYRDDPKHEFIFFDVEDNRANLPKGYIEELERTKDKKWVETFLRGKWGVPEGGGAIISTFKYDRNVSHSPIKVLAGQPIVRGWDSGTDTPACVAFQYVGGVVYPIYANYGRQKTDIRSWISFVKKEMERLYGRENKFLDFAGPEVKRPQTIWQKEQERSPIYMDSQVFLDMGINIEVVSGYIENGEVAIRDLCLPDQGDDRPRLVCNCENADPLIEGLAGGYCLNERGVRKEPNHPYKDLMDAFRYGLMGMGIGVTGIKFNKDSVNEPEYNEITGEFLGYNKKKIYG